MRTCTDADYGRISLAVLQKDKPCRPGPWDTPDATYSLLPRLHAGLGGRSRGTASTAPPRGRGLLLMLILGVVLPLIHLPKETASNEAVPERLARLMVEVKPKPPVPPPPWSSRSPNPKSSH